MLVRTCCIAALGGFLFGYDLGLIGGALLKIKDAFNITDSFLLEAIVSAAKFGATGGTFLGGAAMLRYGRQRALASTSIFFTLGPLVMAVAEAPWLLIVGRFITGIGVGMSAIVAPTYMAELAPASSRGALVQLYEMMLCIGMLYAPLMDWALSGLGPHSWRLMVGLPALPGLVLAGSRWLLPESPRWLVMHNRMDEAFGLLQRIMRRSTPGNAPRESAHGGLGPGPAATQASVTGKGPSWWQRGASYLPLSFTSEFEHHAMDELATQEAEDELLQLWSAVEKDRSAVLERKRLLVRTRGRNSPSRGSASGRSMVKPPSLTTIPEEQGMVALSSSDIDVDSERASDPGGRQAPRSSKAYAPLPGEDERPAARCASSFSAQGTGARLLEESPPLESSSGATAERCTWPRTSGSGAFAPPGEEPTFFHTILSMMLDIWGLTKGAESRAFYIALGLAFFDQVTASTAIVNYAPSMVAAMHDIMTAENAMLYTAVIGITKALGVGIALLLVDMYGRRPLLISGGIACAGALVMSTVCIYAGFVRLFLASLCLFIFFFSLSWAGLYWVVVSELFSMVSKSPATSAATALLFLTGAVTNMLFLTMMEVMGPSCFLVFGGLSALAAAYVWALLPETRGKSLNDVQALVASSTFGSAGRTTRLGSDCGTGVRTPPRCSDGGRMPRWSEGITGRFGRWSDSNDPWLSRGHRSSDGSGNVQLGRIGE